MSLESLTLPAALAARRRDLIELLELSRRQLQLIEADDYAQLVSVQGRKQQILERLNAISPAAPTLKDRWARDRDLLPPDDRRECDRTLAESESLLATLLEEEQASATRLVERRDETQKQLESLGHGALAHDAYRRSLPTHDARNLDINR